MTVLGVLLIIWLLFGFQKMLCGNEKAFHVFDAKSTIPLRGLLAVMIVLHHFNTLYPQQYPWLNQVGFWGVPVCTLFFFFSGYGLTVSYQKKGSDYLSHFFSKRLFKLILPVLIVVACHLICLLLFGMFDLTKIWNNLKSGIPILPHLWFVCTLCLFYCVFYASMKGIRPMLRGVFLCVAIVIYILVIRKLGWGSYWYGSIHGFLLGTFVATYEKTISSVMSNHPMSFMSCFAFVLISCTLYCIWGECGVLRLPAWGTMFYWFLPVAVYFLCRLFPFPSVRPFVLLGTISLEIYLVHVSVMTFLHSQIANPITFVMIVLIVTFCCALGIKQIMCLIE